MDELQLFFAENDIAGIEKEIKVSNRIPHKFKIKAINQTQFGEMQKKCTSKLQKDGASFDGAKFNVNLILESCIYPNFRDASFIESLRVARPEDAIVKCLLPGEISNLSTEIQGISGFNSSIIEDIEEAKN